MTAKVGQKLHWISKEGAKSILGVAPAVDVEIERFVVATGEIEKRCKQGLGESPSGDRGFRD